MSGESFLEGVRVLEVGNELCEYAGKLLAGLGAEVVKVEPPEGEQTRTYGPFARGRQDGEHSLHHWHYNFGKFSITLDLDTDAGQARFIELAASFDVILEARPGGYMRERGLDHASLLARNPRLIYSRISPFGDDGPWRDFVGSDLVHLALGGVMMNCGYDPEPAGRYDTPPIAPQAWHAYQIAGEMAALATTTALNYRLLSGRGQYLSTAVHDAVSKSTETDIPSWVFLHQEHQRKTCRHSMPAGLGRGSSIARTKDGHWVLPYRTYLPGGEAAFRSLLRLLIKHGMAEDLTSPEYLDDAYRADPYTGQHIADVTDRFIVAFKYDRDIWREAQDEGLTWAPIRAPHENASDPHFAARDTFFHKPDAETREMLTHVGAKWYSADVSWRTEPVAPRLGEHNDIVRADIVRADIGQADHQDRPVVATHVREPGDPLLSRHDKPFALSHIRVIDLSWMLASAGAGRFLTAHGAEVLKVEHKSRWDGMRWGLGVPSAGGRAERDAATGPLESAPITTPNQGGSFMEINAGKLGISLNLKSDRGRELLRQLLASADVVVEGFSPGTMKRMGFGYDELQRINPRLIYVQQSGLGEHGTYGGMRTYGPSAAAFAGTSEMSGMPAPYPPAGIGYSYLDWFGAYNMAGAVIAALYRQRLTGKGCYIDSSQVEAGIYLVGPTVLDHSVNGAVYERTGNRSPFKVGAPHGAYPTAGDDRWLAVSCFDDHQWSALRKVLDVPSLNDSRFDSMTGRLDHQDELDEAMAQATAGYDGYELMYALQAEGVAAGVCQTARDRCDTDPQLRHLGWQVELDQIDLGRWPVKEIPTSFSETPPYIGGRYNRSGPSYAQDNDYVFSEWLGLSGDEIRELAAADVI